MKAKLLLMKTNIKLAMLFRIYKLVKIQFKLFNYISKMSYSYEIFLSYIKINNFMTIINTFYLYLLFVFYFC
jgi:hypothetical protein